MLAPEWCGKPRRSRGAASTVVHLRRHASERGTTTTGEGHQDRLAILEVMCRLTHTEEEVSALAQRRAFPAMPEGRRAERLTEVEAKLSALQQRRDELAERVPDLDQVQGPDGTLPAERRRANLKQYLAQRLARLGALEAKVEHLDTVLADKAAPTNVRRHAREARAIAITR